MATPMRHLLSQTPVIGALVRTALDSVIDRARETKREMPTEIPGPWIEAILPPRDPSLVKDYIRFTGGDPGWYKNTLPPHMFPQWAFPLVTRAMRGMPFPMLRAMNAGCRIEPRQKLPANEPLIVRARIESIEQDERKALITQRIITGTRSAPDALMADMRVYVPLESGKDGSVREPKRRATVPASAREIAFVRFGADAGREFAKLTGDINPIHILPAYARASGFRSCILHGFATFARAVEALDRARFAGDPTRLKVFDARFTRPLVLPARVGIYVGPGNEIRVGDAPGGGAYLEGSFQSEV